MLLALCGVQVLCIHSANLENNQINPGLIFLDNGKRVFFLYHFNSNLSPRMVKTHKELTLS